MFKKTIRSLVAAALCLGGLATNLHAGQASLLATNNLMVLTASTNLLNGQVYAGSSSDITFQPVCTFTNATTNTFVFDASANGSTWVSRVLTMTVSQTTATTNTVSGSLTNLPAAFRYPFWRVWVENPSIYTTTPKLWSFTKSGI